MNQKVNSKTVQSSECVKPLMLTSTYGNDSLGPQLVEGANCIHRSPKLIYMVKTVQHLRIHRANNSVTFVKFAVK